MAVRAVPPTFNVAFAFLEAAYDGHGRRRREAEDAFDMPDDQLRRHFRLTEQTVWWLCDEATDELKGSRPTALSVERPVLCALRFYEERGDRSGDAARGQQLCGTCGLSNRQRWDPQQVGSLP
ncbi:hypothetical protein MTO96_049796 [Rhipicephalus appendiculatus]